MELPEETYRVKCEEKKKELNVIMEKFAKVNLEKKKGQGGSGVDGERAAAPGSAVITRGPASVGGGWMKNATAAVGRTAEVAEVGTMTMATRTVKMIPSSRSEGATGVPVEEAVVEVARTVAARATRTGIECQPTKYFHDIF